MKKLLLSIAYLFVLIIVKAQSDTLTPKKPKPFVASIQGMNDENIKGDVVSVNDSGMMLRSYDGSFKVPAENIGSLTLKRKNSVLRGTLMGLGIGVASGMIIGFAQGNSPDKQIVIPNIFDPGSDLIFTVAGTRASQKALIGATTLGLTGTITGAIIGAVAKKTFIIGGKKEKFHDLQGEIMAKLLRKQ